MSVDLDALKLRVETDFDNSVLQRVLDSVKKAVERAHGNAASEVETQLASGSEYLALHRQSQSFTSITERRRTSTDAVTLSANDYRKVGGYRLMRLVDGDNPARFWGAEVVITYVPVIDEDIRDRVILDLCLLDINFNAFDSYKSGNWTGTQKDWRARRRELLAQIREGQCPIA